MENKMLSECLCPICISILIEPVTMPCNHSLCMPCYKETVEKANLTCPVCRKRISVWARKAAKNNTLINMQKWKAIQEVFPEKVRHRLEGSEESNSESEEDNFEAQLRRLKELSEPGEIRQEYEAALEKIRQQKEEEAKKEEEASRALIEALQQEELLELERMKSEMVEIEHVNRQKALELEKIGKSQKNGILLSPANAKSLKQKSLKKKNQKTLSPSSMTLTKFYPSVPRKALSPLHLPDLEDVPHSSDHNKRRKICTDLPPGLADFCYHDVGENVEEPPSLTKLNPLEPGPSRVTPSQIDNGADNESSSISHLPKKLNISSYLPVVLCEKKLKPQKFIYSCTTNNCLSVSDCDSETLHMSTNGSDSETSDTTLHYSNVDHVEKVNNSAKQTDSDPAELNNNGSPSPTKCESSQLTENRSAEFACDSSAIDDNISSGNSDLVLPTSSGAVKKRTRKRVLNCTSVLTHFNETANKGKKGTPDIMVKSLNIPGGESTKTLEKQYLPVEDSYLSQEESDRLMALKLQEMYELMDKKRIAVDRFKGSSNEYTLRRKRKCDE
ncbi:E3 ubiquitin-protein ligase RNF168 [Biomphalaria pfeifferi]|uniref:RING-type E3 ubiquitin transferase n=1 Tax=Biomphalaria pfeifferi TaxID=112525 RepID=A0AAD8C5A6_BIOPF|nr:E3 ubiquitin-protein ligase RNF168 [Biomphalaria pfeifferi]